jgi:putative acetyltransferase
MRIRAYEKADAESVSRVFQRSVEMLGPRDYSAAQVAAWASRAPDAERLHVRMSDGRTVFVAVDESDAVLGFIDLEADGHIDLLYCAPEVAGAGIAAALYDAVESLGRARGMARLYSEASEAALRFFLKRGFVKLRRRDLMISDVAIHNYEVEKALV